MRGLYITIGEVKVVEQIYSRSIHILKYVGLSVVPYCRRLIRFVALPYCYFFLIDWPACRVGRFQVAIDLLYIFFKLKYFPDNYSPCRLWETDKEKWCQYYGSMYDPYQRSRLRKEVQPKEYLILFNNKRVCYLLCKSLEVPVPQEFGLFAPKGNYKQVLRDILKNQPELKLILKPNLGRGGHGISIAYNKDGDIYVEDGIGKNLLDDFSLSVPSVVQTYIRQHDSLYKISTSANTVRIITLLTKNNNDVLIVGAYMRFGIGNAFIDNLCEGGIAAGVNIDKGSLMEFAYDLNGNSYTKHPTSGQVFKGFQVPFWQELIVLVKRIQREFSFYKMLGHDVVITESGPIIIEINDSPDNVAMEMICGPILANNKIRVEFNDYNLLINKPSKNLVSP